MVHHKIFEFNYMKKDLPTKIEESDSYFKTKRTRDKGHRSAQVQKEAVCLYQNQQAI